MNQGKKKEKSPASYIKHWGKQKKVKGKTFQQLNHTHN